MIGNVEKPCFRLYKNMYINSSRFPTPEMAHSPARPKTSPQNQCSSLNLEHTAQYVEDILSPSSYDRFLECLLVSFRLLLVNSAVPPLFFQNNNNKSEWTEWIYFGIIVTQGNDYS